MRKHYLLFYFLALILFSTCKSRENPDFLIETPTGVWELIWADEFDYTGLPDSSKWNFDTEGNEWGWGNQELQWYTENDVKNAWVSEGLLTITAHKEAIHGKEYTSARLTTKNKGDWKYGRVEVRAKVPAGKGTWSAIWMLPSDTMYGPWPLSGEIDIMEHVGYAPDSVFSTVHTQQFNYLYNTHVGEGMRTSGLPDQFNLFALEWEENQIRSYLNDTLYFSFTDRNLGFHGWPFNQRFHLLLNLAVGGNLGAKEGVDPDDFPHQFQVDYVRVYKKKK